MSQTPQPPTQTTPLPGQMTSAMPQGGARNSGFTSAGGFGSANGAPPNQGKLVVIAIVLGVIAVGLLNLYIFIDRNRNEIGEFTVYRLTQNARPGDPLREGVYQAIQVPNTFEDSFANAVKPGEGGAPTYEGEPFERYATAGSIITDQMFLPPETDDFDRLVNSGERVYPIPVRPEDISSTIRPGTYIDILGNFQIDGHVSPQPVMQYVRIYSIAGFSATAEQSTGPGDAQRVRGFSTIDLILTPEQVLYLQALKREVEGGNFTIAVRKRVDREATYPEINADGFNTRLRQLIRESSGDED